MNAKMGRLKHRPQRGLGLYLLLLIMFFLLPVMLVMIKKGISQNRFSLTDRNIRTAREMAESICYEFVNTFAENWNRNVFNTLMTSVPPTAFAGLGNVRYTIAQSIPQATMDIWTVATYNRGGASLASAQKGVDALFFWANDLFKFDLVWPNGATLGGNVDQLLPRMNGRNMRNSVYVGGNLNMGQQDTTLSGLWVVKGTMTVPSHVVAQDPVNFRVHCVNWIKPRGASFGVSQFPPDAFVPSLTIVPPEGELMGGSLSRYFTNATRSTAPAPGDILQLALGAGGADSYTISYVSGGGDLLWGPVVTPYFMAVAAATAPWVFSSSGVDVEILASTITRPITVAVLDGSARITGDVRYGPILGVIPPPGPTRSFALLAEGEVILDSIDPMSPPPIVLDGFYGSTQSGIRILGNRSVTVRGTLYGPISQFAPMPGTPFSVTASTGLGAYPPPLFPRRPRTVRWDYVP
jgi:hypothetical protein